MTDQPYTPPPGDQAQLDALEAYLPLLNNLVTLAQDHYDDTALLARLLRDGSPLVVGEEKVIHRDQAYKTQGESTRAFLQAFAAMQQAAQRVGDAIARHELKLGRAAPDVVTGQKGAPRKEGKKQMGRIRSIRFGKSEAEQATAQKIVEALRGPRSRINTYTCETCGGRIVTEDVDDGTTAFMIKCRATNGCAGRMVSAYYRCDQTLMPEWEWYQPDLQAGRAKFSLPEWEHVLQGGLLLRRKEAPP